MELILSKHCEFITGSLGRQFGYHISHRKNGFFVIRNAKSKVPPDGHWKMICACANLAEMKLHIADIKVSAEEVADALSEAGLTTPAYCLKAYPEDYPKEFNTVNINKLKIDFNL
jgi:hypothetical protein